MGYHEDMSSRQPTLDRGSKSHQFKTGANHAMVMGMLFNDYRQVGEKRMALLCQQEQLTPKGHPFWTQPVPTAALVEPEALAFLKEMGSSLSHCAGPKSIRQEALELNAPEETHLLLDTCGAAWLDIKDQAKQRRYAVENQRFISLRLLFERAHPVLQGNNPPDALTLTKQAFRAWQQSDTSARREIVKLLDRQDLSWSQVRNDIRQSSSATYIDSQLSALGAMLARVREETLSRAWKLPDTPEPVAPPRLRM